MFREILLGNCRNDRIAEITALSTDWESIVAEHGRMVVQAAFRLLGNAADAEEVAQEVFLEVISQSASANVRNWGAYAKRGRAEDAPCHLRQGTGRRARTVLRDGARDGRRL